jgi:hypothetical protein
MAVDPGRFYVRAVADRVASGESVTLLCSSACTDEAQCHRSVLAELIRRRRPGKRGASTGAGGRRARE